MNNPEISGYSGVSEAGANYFHESIMFPHFEIFKICLLWLTDIGKKKGVSKIAFLARIISQSSFS